MTRDDYDRVWTYDRETEQARWDEAQDEALQASADRFEQGEERESVSDRFYVTEHSGYPINAQATQASNQPLRTEVLVLDRAYCHKVVWSSWSSLVERHTYSFTTQGKGSARQWRKKVWKATARLWPLPEARAYAADLAAQLNAGGEHGA